MRIVLLFLVLSGPTFGQRVLYSQGLDEKGKAASAAAKKLTSSSLTDNELANLAVLEKAQIDRVLSAATITMRREIEALSTWGSVAALVNGIERNINLVNLDSGSPQEIKERQEAIKKETERLQEELKALKDASKEDPPSLDPVIGLLGNIKEIADFASEAGKIKEAKQASSSLKEALDGLKELNTLIASVNTIWTTAKRVRVDPKTLAPSKEETELAVLAVEGQYLKELTLLRAQKHLDQAAVLAFHTEIGDLLTNFNLKSQIRDSLSTPKGLTAENNDNLRLQLRVLHLAASASAQNMIAADIVGVRETLAWRRYQVRTKAIYNGTYESAIKAASDRLSAYYGAGLKAAQIAQLLHDLAAMISLPAIAF